MANNTNYIASGDEHLISLQSVDGYSGYNPYYLTFGALAFVLLLQSSYAASKTFKAPFVGFRSAWEPKFLVGLRFSYGALAQVTEGYNKV